MVQDMIEEDDFNDESNLLLVCFNIFNWVGTLDDMQQHECSKKNGLGPQGE